MKRLLLVVVALLAVTLSATHSSAFPLGVYSSLGNKDSVYNHRDMYISWMNSLSYNSNIMELFSEGTQPNGEFVHSELDFSGVLASMASHGIDAIVKDRSWKEGEDEHSSFYLSKSNYVKIQAQIFDQNTVGNAYLTNNDNYWYSSNGVHINGSEPIPFAPTPGLNRVGGYNQTDNVWECVPNDHVAGYAYGDLKSRWGSDPPLVHKLFSIQPPPPTETDDESVFTDSDALYITYHIKIVSPPELPANTPLLYFRVAFYDQNGNVIAIPSVVTGPANTVITDGLLTNTVYSTFATPGYFDVTAKVRFQDLAHPPGFPDVSLITFDNTWTIQSLNPRLYWYDNCTLYLDNIEIEDSIYRDLNSNDPLYLAAVTARVQEVSLLGSNVVGIYTNDEPTQAQFDSYELMQGMVGTTRLSMTAVKRQDSHILKQSGPYNHYVVFDHEAQPKVYMPDPYPVLGTVGWSSGITIGNLHLQSEISSMNKYAYDYNRRMCSSSEFFYPVVQAFGRWHGGTSQIWDNFFMRPPSATQQMLQYLPLCFGADGIFNYRLIGFHNTTSGSGDYCAITCDYDQATTTDPAYYYEPIVDQQTYDTLLECNPRVRMYGELLNKNGVSWDLSASLEQTGTLQEIDLVAVNTDYQPNLANYKLNSIQLGPENGSYYKGYIQMGFYSDDNIPSLMLVNRRSNYFNGSPASVTPILAANLVPPNDDFPAYFPEFPGQVVIFEPSNASHTMFGTHVAFHDPYDNVIYPTDIDGTISVDIGPGDGKLVQMCSSLPALVTSDAELKEIAYLTGSVTIDDGAHVSIQNGTNTTILANSTIRVKGGSSLSLSGTVSIKESVTIIVEEGSSINFNDAICTWGEGSTLEVTGSTLSIDSSSMDRSDTASRWNGIRVIESSHVTINDATISNTESNTIHDSDLLITNSRFNILPNLWGLSLKNSNLGYQTSIINTEPGCGFYGDPNFCSMGILLYAMKNQVVINNVDFQNLYFGVYKYSTPYATDTISECRFVNCTNGIYLHGNDNGTSIEQCSFACDNGRTQGTGILLVASAPSISTSNFTNLYRGVFTEYSLLGIGLGSSGVHESNFYYCETGIESRSSNH